MTDQQRFYELAQGRADSTEGICVDVLWGSRTVLVNTNGVEAEYPWEGPPPWPGDRVRVVKAGVGNVVCTLVMGAPLGTVLTTAAGVATVDGDDGLQYVYPHLGSAPANGARVRLDHAGRCVPAGTYSVEPAGSDFVTPPPPPATGGSATFTPTWSGSWRLGTLDNSGVESSQNRVAGVGFGDQIVNTIPAGATVTKCVLLLVREWNNSYSPAAVKFGVHGYGTIPTVLASGDLSGLVSVGQDETSKDISGFAAALKSGSAKGVGIYPDSGYWIRYAPAPTGVRIYMEWTS